jgi:hypothetical protein
MIIVQPQPSAADLFSKDPIFFAQVIDGILLLLIHPAGHGDEHKAERIKALVRFAVQSLLCIWRSGRQRPGLSIRSDFWTLRVRAMWPECPARISEDGQYLLLKQATALISRGSAGKRPA